MASKTYQTQHPWLSHNNPPQSPPTHLVLNPNQNPPPQSQPQPKPTTPNLCQESQWSSLRINMNICNYEAIASEAVPSWQRSAFRVHDLEVDWDVPWQSLRVSFQIHKEPTIVAANLEVLAPQNVDPQTQTHEPKLTNLDPWTQTHKSKPTKSLEHIRPRPMTMGEAQSSVEHTHRRSTEREERRKKWREERER